MILAIDSSIGTAVAVVGLHGNCLSRAEVEDRRSHAEAIGPLISRALADATATPADVTAVVMGVGPGPFTGLRVGMAAAEAFAWARKIPLWPVLSHDSGAWDLQGETVVASDARRGEYAVTVYQPLPGRALAIKKDQTKLVRKDVLDSVDRLSATPVLVLERVDPCRLARAALWYREHGEQLMPAQAVYLRAPDVTMPK